MRRMMNGKIFSQNTWLLLKEKFVAAWTNSYLHLGTTVTSCIEGAYSTLKSYLQTSTEYTLVLEIEENTVCDEDALQPLLQNLQERYQEWPRFQQAATCNPKEVFTRGCPSNVSQHSSVNSTRRDPSGFELVEHKEWQYTL
ncbi:23908_t:CDS:2 [Gigaspora margarita]|uniref:23908_t:CDS:1 n=1 Tax=Gigaspora margarita TaxID=4874 RepID=A0ABN7V7Q0_GIGMA|nr:23908_t:CDS:2 [Gigaspora margarita]